MAAAAFKANLIFKQGANTLTRYATVSDVNGQYYTFQDGNTFLTLPAGNWTWTDLILSAAGTDTTNASVYLNGAPTSLQIVNAANISTVLQRQIQQTCPVITGGSTIKIVQVT